MAKPSIAPVDAKCAEPTSTGGICGPPVSMTSEALGATVPLNEEASSGPEGGGCCGKSRGRGGAPLRVGSRASPNKLNCDCAAAVPLLTRVKVVVQFSLAAMCGIEPM